ncbi:MAG: hypothetical protein A2719_01200 [Candidatus Ryanbacteria bacterium RIFCSPHIGHO2_01_FULL_45_22]|uniref:Heat-inducible transcription repressor HrcA C-terminal domain-containing protein n=2 Tax=Candidatus Ryaniibacteriota TaxID=1817914 RepID=A0A1G2G032_9BACT|nr:MAG: hypothetical protein A2719_01200 [Candidatus Ryanbacteria bacterium RIFCSPHIGHO2_01_FULL_45_22]OGZ46346.1 MAG: hypothetical protein A3J54_04085 [Candidatus Ryanbacteria bacterium RIFCSPHIGHO2_02_FULL_45_13b]
MKLLSEREQDVLEVIIRDYITNATPVSSERVREISGREVSSATFRAIMGDLETSGYLVQPHTSAGRIPTQKGYRFFVDSCITYPSSQDNHQRSYDNPEDLIRYIVSQTRLLGVYVHRRENVYVQFGIGPALRSPEFSDTEHACAFGDFVDAVQNISDLYHNMLAKEHKSQAIFIERENPTPEGRSLGVVVSQSNNNGTIFVIGPSRMDYEQVLRILINH